MGRGIDTELNEEHWNKIADDLFSSDINEKAKAQTNMVRKVVLSIVNLQETIKDHRTKTTISMNKLTESIDKFNDSSEKVVTWGVIVSGVIATATIAQVIVALFNQNSKIINSTSTSGAIKQSTARIWIALAFILGIVITLISLWLISRITKTRSEKKVK